MQKLLAALILCATATVSLAQSSLKGKVTDTLNTFNLANAVITISDTKDAALYKFTRAKPDGFFAINNIRPGKYTLLISYPGYVDYVDTLQLSENKHADIGTVNMLTRAHVLKEVIVRQTIAAIRMRGDTVEFKADSFKVMQGANVETLLKKLPGLQVDKDGSITAMGQKVEKVLVDGEEFFGNDPTVATKNLQASIVDKVQVFDKKSDQATFTGIDDGETSKTVNLKLKDGSKKGYFGKLDIAGGLDDKWNNSAMFNRFRAKQKFSLYGVMSSTGKTGLNWDEGEKYGGESSLEYDSDNDYFYSVNDDDFGSRYYGQGLPKSWAAGANYANKFAGAKQNINGSYRYNRLTSKGGGNTITQNILPKGELITEEQSRSINSKQRHSANATYEWQIDSTTSLKISGNGYTGFSNGYSGFSSITYNESDSLINKNVRNSTSDGDNQQVKGSMIFRKKFKKTGRTFSLNFEEQYKRNSSTGFLNATITTFDNNRQPVDSITDQRKVSNGSYLSLNARAVYTEPLLKKVFGEVSYAFRTSVDNSERLSYNKADDGKYIIPTAAFSNHYKYEIYTHTAGLAFKYSGKKIAAGIGSDIAFQDEQQKDIFKDTIRKRDYANLFPKANFSYKFNSNTRLSLNYNGNTRQPSMFQIQPITDNSDPLTERIGNPGLKQSFNHSFSLNYHSYNVLKQSGCYAWASFDMMDDDIVSNQYTDAATGKSIYQYVNVSGNYDVRVYGSYYGKLKKPEMDWRVGPGLSVRRTKNFVNGLSNTTDTYNPDFSVTLGKSKEKKYDIEYRVEVGYNYATSTVNNSIKTNYWTYTHEVSGTAQLPFRMELNANVNGEFRQKTALFDKNNNVVLINGYLGRKFLKDDKAILKIGVNDLLDQNKGYDRYINNSIIQEKSYETLARYFYIGFTWNFFKNPGQ